MSKRRNFLALMAGTASLGVLSSITTGIFKPQPSYAGVEQCGTITNDAGKIAEEAIKAAGALGQLALRMSGGIKSASASESETFGESVARSKAASAAEFQSLVKTFDESVDRDIEFWSKPDSLTSFVMSASVNEHNKSIQSMKGKFSSQQISAALSKAIKNLEANNISAIESDPIIGPAAKAGYAAASSKLKQLANLRRQYSTNLKDIPAKVSARVETEAVSLRRQGKLTNQQIQKFSSSYPSLAPAFRKALDLPAKPGLPGAVPGQLKSDPKLLNQ